MVLGTDFPFSVIIWLIKKKLSRIYSKPATKCSFCTDMNPTIHEKFQDADSLGETMKTGVLDLMWMTMGEYNVL